MASRRDNSPGAESDFLPLSEVAPKIGTTPAYLNTLIKRGKLQAKKIGRDWFTTKEWVVEYLANQRPSFADPSTEWGVLALQKPSRLKPVAVTFVILVTLAVWGYTLAIAGPAGLLDAARALTKEIHHTINERGGSLVYRIAFYDPKIERTQIIIRENIPDSSRQPEVQRPPEMPLPSPAGWPVAGIQTRTVIQAFRREQ